MSARDDIFRRVRAAQGTGAASSRVSVSQAIESICTAHVQGPRIQIDPATYVARFKKRSEALSSTVDMVETLTEVPEAVRRYLASLAQDCSAVIWSTLLDLPWGSHGVTVEARQAQGSDRVGITGCFCAIAETGTLMMLSGPETPASTSLLPETHIAIVPQSRIVAGMEEGWALLRQERGALPRAVNFISGPSRTADIEQTLVLGAHGPSRVHLVMITGA